MDQVDLEEYIEGFDKGLEWAAEVLEREAKAYSEQGLTRISDAFRNVVDLIREEAGENP